MALSDHWLFSSVLELAFSFRPEMAGIKRLWVVDITRPEQYRQENYFPEFAKLSSLEKEQWYDRIYDQSLILFVLLEYQSRNGDIQAFKHSAGN